MNILKFMATNRFLRYSPFYWWWRLINHSYYRLDDFNIKREFFSSINQGWEMMEYKWVFEEFWGRESYPPPTITLPEKDFDTLQKRLNEPPDPKVQKGLREILNRKAPWDT